MFIHIEGAQCMFCNAHIDHAIAQNLGKIAHPPQQSIGDAGRTATRLEISAAASEVIFVFRMDAERVIIFWSVT